MYVADVTSIAELRELLAEARNFLLSDPRNAEQYKWDIEDIESRIAELGETP
jgi:hypothetical protein